MLDPPSFELVIVIPSDAVIKQFSIIKIKIMIFTFPVIENTSTLIYKH